MMEILRVRMNPSEKDDVKDAQKMMGGSIYVWMVEEILWGGATEVERRN